MGHFVFEFLVLLWCYPAPIPLPYGAIRCVCHFDSKPAWKLRIVPFCIALHSVAGTCKEPGIALKIRRP